MRLTLFSALFLLFTSPLLASDMETRKAEWNQWTEEIKAGRQEPDSYIFYESYKSADQSGEIYVTRTQNGPSINKISSSLEKPEKLAKGEKLLGVVKKDSKAEGKYSLHADNGTVVPLKIDELVKHKDLGLLLYEYDDEMYVNFYNYQRPYRQRLENPEFFPFDPQWVVEVKFKEDRQKLKTPASNGEEWEDERLGYLNFEYRGQKLKVAVYEYNDFDGLEGDVQIRFGDQSESTYPGGRYLYAKISDVKNPQGFTLDFNRAFDPPCAWSQGYECSLIRPDELLPIKVEAGLKTPLADLY